MNYIFDLDKQWVPTMPKYRIIRTANILTQHDKSRYISQVKKDL